MSFSCGHRFVLDSPRHDEELAFGEFDDSIAEVDFESAVEDEEEFIFLLVMMPDEFAFDLREFDLLTVEFADDPRACGGCLVLSIVYGRENCVEAIVEPRASLDCET